MAEALQTRLEQQNAFDTKMQKVLKVAQLAKGKEGGENAKDKTASEAETKENLNLTQLNTELGKMKTRFHNMVKEKKNNAPKQINKEDFAGIQELVEVNVIVKSDTIDFPFNELVRFTIRARNNRCDDQDPMLGHWIEDENGNIINDVNWKPIADEDILKIVDVLLAGMTDVNINPDTNKISSMTMAVAIPGE